MNKFLKKKYLIKISNKNNLYTITIQILQNKTNINETEY